MGLLAIAPATASATVLYTTPTGGFGGCTEEIPCSLDTALAWASEGDEVRLTAEEYRRTTRLEIFTPNLTISGPPGRYSPTDFRAFLIFEGVTTGPNILVQANGLALERVSIAGGAGSGNVMINARNTVDLRLDRVSIVDAGSEQTVVAQDASIVNSIIRQDSGGYAAVGITGAVYGSTVTSADAIAIVNDDAYHDFPNCSLELLNTIAVGAAGNLVTANGVGGCLPDIRFGYSWIPRDPGFGGDGIIDPGRFTVAGPGNLPDSPPALPSPFSGNFGLALDSPAIDTGDTGCGGSCGIEDFYGRPRPIGPENDIGATETILPPWISTVGVDSVTSTRARISAAINPNGGATTWNFQIRKSGSSAWEAVVGAVTNQDTEPVIVSGIAQPLEPLTSYELRLSGINESGVERFSRATTTLRTEGVRITSAGARVTAGKVTVKTKVRTSGPGRVDLRAITRPGGSKTWCRTDRRVTAAGIHDVNCQIGRKGRKKLRKAPLRLTLRAAYSSGSRVIDATRRNLTIPRKR